MKPETYFSHREDYLNLATLFSHAGSQLGQEPRFSNSESVKHKNSLFSQRGRGSSEIMNCNFKQEWSVEPRNTIFVMGGGQLNLEYELSQLS